MDWKKIFHRGKHHQEPAMTKPEKFCGTKVPPLTPEQRAKMEEGHRMILEAIKARKEREKAEAEKEKQTSE